METYGIPSLKQINSRLIGSINDIVSSGYRVTAKFYKKKTVIQCFGNKYDIFDIASYLNFKESISVFIKNKTNKNENN